MRIVLVSRVAWPAAGGTEVVVATTAAALSGRHAVRIFAHRIDNRGVGWFGPFDRAPWFARLVDPMSHVITTQLRLTPLDLAALAPLPALSRAPPRHGQLQAKLRPAVESLHGKISGRRFAAQIGDVDIIHRFGGNRLAVATVRAARRLARIIHETVAAPMVGAA